MLHSSGFMKGVPAGTKAREAAAARSRRRAGGKVAGPVRPRVPTAQGSAGSQVCVPVGASLGLESDSYALSVSLL